MTAPLRSTADAEKEMPSANPWGSATVAAFVLWSLLTCAILLDRSTAPMTDIVYPWAGPPKAVILSIKAWDPSILILLRKWIPGIPLWSQQALAAVALTAACFPIVRAAPLLGGILLIGLAFRGASVDTAMLTILALLCYLSPRVAEKPAKGRLALLLIALMAFATGVSVDFGLAPLLLILGAAGWRQGSPRRVVWLSIVSSATVIALAFGHWYGSTFSATLLRPLSCLWYRADPALFPSLAALGAAPLSLSDWLLAGTVGAALIRIAWRFDTASHTTTPAVIGLAAIGLACRWYLPAAALVAGYSCHGHVSIAGDRRPGKLAILSAVAVWIAAAFHVAPSLAMKLQETTPAGLAPQQWQVAGSVLLFDLDDAASWSTPDMSRYRPVVTDRWELFGSHYPLVGNVCDDLAELRNESYLRSDGSTGGYERYVRHWDVKLLVVPTTRHSALRVLSLNPQWRMLGIDARQVVFGRANDRQFNPLASRAGQELRSLEWPSAFGQPPERAQIVYSDSSSRLSVARVLGAMRLPYAALRILPDRSDRAVDRERAWLYTELAHRYLRHAGQASVLEEFRANCRWRPLLDGWREPAKSRLDICRSLEALGLLDLAEEFAAPLDRFPARWFLTREQSDELSALLARAASARQRLPSQTSETSINDVRHSAEQAAHAGLVLGARNLLATWLDRSAVDDVANAQAREETARQAVELSLRLGDSQTAMRLAPHVRPNRQPYYEWLGGIGDTPPSEAAGRLGKVLESASGWSDPERAEALFQLGCLQLEAGDAASALQSFHQSRTADPNAPCRYLRDLHSGALAPRGQ